MCNGRDTNTNRTQEKTRDETVDVLELQIF